MFPLLVVLLAVTPVVATTLPGPPEVVFMLLPVLTLLTETLELVLGGLSSS
jgi:hypothetical protein